MPANMIRIILKDRQQAIEIAQRLILSNVDFAYRFMPPESKSSSLLTSHILSQKPQSRGKENVILCMREDLTRVKVALSTVTFTIRYND